MDYTKTVSIKMLICKLVICLSAKNDLLCKPNKYFLTGVKIKQTAFNIFSILIKESVNNM